MSDGCGFVTMGLQCHLLSGHSGAHDTTGPNLISQAVPDALTQALARLDDLEDAAKTWPADYAKAVLAVDNLTGRVQALEAQVRELQAHVHTSFAGRGTTRGLGFELKEPGPKDNGGNAPPCWCNPNKAGLRYDIACPRHDA